jgi:tetratricopeptide (TPR) repeat protein
MRNTSQTENGFVQRKLPWIVAGAALLLYLITFSPWITLRGLPTLIKASGWDWRPSYVAPLTYLITFPVRWFPIAWQPAVLNLISVFCGALTIGLLARSVAILPHDRTREQRHYERSPHSILSISFSWLPPIFAALVLGLQMNFWENAVVTTGEAIDILLFAYVIRCLLEFRIDERESWLLRAALIYGVGMANDLAFLPLLPLFVGAIVWIRGLAFFNVKFLVRIASWGAVGLSLYLLLPLINVFAGTVDQSFWEFLKINVGFQKSTILGFPRYIVFLLSLVSVFPIIFMGIKWPQSFADINAAGAALTNLMSHVIHGVFLLAGLYVAFDPPFSPRRLGQGMAFLPLIYLSCLSIGYFAGYFLLVFNPKSSGPFGRPTALRKTAGYALTSLVWVAAVLVPVGLAITNFGQIRANHGPEIGNFGKHAAGSLPKDGAMVLSDDSLRLFALHSALARQGTADKFILLDTSALTSPEYHSVLGKRYTTNWPVSFGAVPAHSSVSQPALVQLLYDFSRRKSVYYLHPSFGYYFETFHAVPKGCVSELVVYPTNSISGPLLSKDQVQENDAFWQQLRSSELNDLIAAVKRSRTKKQLNASAGYTASIYAQAVNQFGVELQKRGDLADAERYFKFALELNPDNATALINSEYNKVLQSGGRESGPPSQAVAKALHPYYGNWERILGFNGPMDEPNSCYLLAETLAKGRNLRQSAQYLERVCTLTPSNISAQVALASVFVQGGQTDYALRKVEEIRNIFPKLSENHRLLLAECEAWSYSMKNDFPRAQQTLLRAQKEYPARPEPFKSLAEIYLSRRDFTNALAVLNSLIEAQPSNVDGLINYAALKIRMGAYREAIPPLDKALKLEPDNFNALLNHGIANLQVMNLDAARQDYETLARRVPKPMYSVHYALGEIAYAKKQKKTALEHYEKYLKLAPRGTAEMQAILSRVQRLKSGEAI